MNLLRTVAVLAALVAAVLVSTPALARSPVGADAAGRRHHHRRGVPELDSTAAASAAVLLGAGVFVILGRRRAKR